MTLKVDWIDRNRESKCPSNPDFPEGIDVDLSEGRRACTADLPYPARRCGVYVVTCPKCGASVGITTAGRNDDPRSVTIACKVVN